MVPVTALLECWPCNILFLLWSSRVNAQTCIPQALGSCLWSLCPVFLSCKCLPLRGLFAFLVVSLKNSDLGQGHWEGGVGLSVHLLSLSSSRGAVRWPPVRSLFQFSDFNDSLLLYLLL